MLERLVEIYLQGDGALPVPPSEAGVAPSSSTLPSSTSKHEKTSVNLHLHVAEGAVTNSVFIHSCESSPDLAKQLYNLIKDLGSEERLYRAIYDAFNENNRKKVQMRMKSFQSGDRSPTVSIVEFTDDSILGAYIMGQDRILIDENILHSRSLDRVLLEEFGHWLEDGLDDSEGDEGDTFARSLLGLNTRDTPSEIHELYQFVELDGQLLKAEFSQETRRSAFKEVLERLDDLESHVREFTSAFEMLLHRVEALEEKK